MGEGSPTKIDYSEKSTLIRASLLEDLVVRVCWLAGLTLMGPFEAPGICSNMCFLPLVAGVEPRCAVTPILWTCMV